MEFDMLTKPTTESLVYFVFLNPQKQSDGIRIIYGKEPREVNQKPIIEARRRLEQLDYVEIMINKENLRDVIIKSKPKPFIEYTNFRLSEMSKTTKKRDIVFLTREEEKVMEKILDSSWFRNFFSIEILKKLQYPYSFYVFRENGKLVVADVLRMIADIWDTITTMNEVFSLVPFVREKMPKIEDISNVDFDRFATEWVEKNFDSKIRKFVIDCIIISSDYLSPAGSHELLELSKNFYFLCIPTQLATKTSSIGRVELTIFKALLASVKYYLEKWKIPKYILRKFEKYWFSFVD